MSVPIDILLLEDSDSDARLIELTLRRAGIECTLRRVADEAAFRAALAGARPHVVLSDYRVPNFRGDAALAIVQEFSTELPVLFVSGTIGEELAVALMKAGATDCVLKDRMERLPMAVRRALAEAEQREARRQAEAALRASLREKEVLLREVHHRVKNNLQIVSSLLSLQARQLTDPALIAGFAATRERVRTMAAVHERLYETGDLAAMDLGPHIGGLVRMLTKAHAPEGVRLRCAPRLERVMADLNTAVPLSLIINELILNAAKYAYAGRSEGELRIELRAGGERHELLIADDGPGLPAGIEPATAKTLGLRLVRDLARQIRAEVRIQSSDAGTSFRLEWPAQAAEPNTLP